MRILVVEDEDDKRLDVVAALKATFAAAAVVETRSLSSGLSAIAGQSFDLIVLDMTMPTFDIAAGEDGGRPQAFGGRELLRHIRRRGLGTPVIVVTQFDRFGDEGVAQTLEALDEELRTEHADCYRGAIYYSAGSLDWRERLVVLATAAVTPKTS
jgi:CheY-like chemotaxis protein